MGIGAALRVAGAEFEVDRFIESSGVDVCASWHKGDSRRKSAPLACDSGCTMNVSSAEELKQQYADAMLFLKWNESWLKKLNVAWKVIEPVINFSAVMPAGDVYAASYSFPAQLLSLAASFGISIELTFYRVGETELKDDP